MSSSSQQQHSRHHKSTGKGAHQAGNRAAAGASASASVTPTGATSASTTSFQTIRFRTEPPSRPPPSAASATPNEQHQQAKQSRQQSNAKPRLIAPQIQSTPALQPASLLPSQSVPTSSAPSLRRRSVPIPTSAAYMYVGANQHYAVPSDSQASTPGATTGPAAKKGLQPIVPDLITANVRTSAQQLQQLEFFRPQVDYRGPAVLAASPPALAGAAAARNASYAAPAVLSQHTHNTRGRRTSNDVTSVSAASAADATAVRQMTFVTESGQQKLLAAGIRPTSRMLQPQQAGPTELAQRAKLSAAQPAAGAVDKNGEPCRAEPAAAAAATVPRAASSPPDHRETKAGSSAAQTPLRSPSMQLQHSAAPSALLIPPTPAATPNTSTPVSPVPAATPTAPTQTTTTTTSTAAVTSSRARSISKTSPSLPWAPTLPPAILQSRNPISRDEFMKVLDAHVAAEKAAAAAAASAAAMTSNGTIVLASALPPTHHIKPAPPALTIEQPNPAALAVLGKRKWEDFAAAHEAYVAGQREAAAAAAFAAAKPAGVDKKKDEEAFRKAREAEEAAALQLRAPLMEGMPKAWEGEATEVFAERLRVWTEGVARRIIQDATTLLHAHSTTLQTRLLSTYRAHGNAAATLASLRAMLDAERAEHARLVEKNARAPLLAARAGQLETALVDAVVGRVAKKPKATETTTATPMDVDQKDEDPLHELAALQRQLREAEARCSTLEGARQRIGVAAAATSPTAEGTNGLGPAGKLLARLLSGGSAAAARVTAGDAVMSLLASENGIEELMEALDMV
ncbi:hypothetical protein BDZ88DRAFT_455057 [Geranomyces variabilis]|nr:hypothetical protein BDZ88DRAFT_455057 [Geranomyces variabilis]KAJ3136932.1 hypothetical protein HDU90_002498 [Geranomyces variabilis]